MESFQLEKSEEVLTLIGTTKFDAHESATSASVDFLWNWKQLGLLSGIFPEIALDFHNCLRDLLTSDKLNFHHCQDLVYKIRPEVSFETFYFNPHRPPIQ